MKWPPFLLATCAALAQTPTVTRLDLGETPGPVCFPTHIGFLNGFTTLMDSRNSRLLYRTKDRKWHVSPIALKGAHSVALLPNGEYLFNDTDHGAMAEAAGLDRAAHIVRNELAGFPLSRPHDQIVDPATGWIYAIDGNRHLFRFRDLSGPVDVWTFGEKELGYDRALSYFDGAVHIVDSGRGEVLRIDDFEHHRYTVYRSRPGTPDAPAGALKSTGLVLNDVEKFGDYYYGTNYFTRSYAKGADPNPARLIRWRTWQQFEAGEWEDLSDQLPEGLVPYFLTVHDDGLYFAAFNHEDPCRTDGVFVIRLRRP